MDEEGLINAILKAQDENDDDPHAEDPQLGLKASVCVRGAGREGNDEGGQICLTV